MNVRIKTIWTLCLITAVLVFCGQAYWLYSQLAYNVEKSTEQAKIDCAKAFEIDQQTRKALIKDSLSGKDTTKIMMNFDRKNDVVHTKYSYALPGTKRRMTVSGINNNDLLMPLSWWVISSVNPFTKEGIDSILKAKGYDETYNFKKYKTRKCMLSPRFAEQGKLMRTLSVDYSTNPLDFEAVRFTFAVPIATAIKSMMWQLAFCLAMFAILCFCMTYLIRTIIVQKRIDDIRHEFMKNMIYEMKQPPANEPSDVIRIGDTDFYYSANELRHGSKRVIITSRQAEILRLLAQNKNEVVTRETLLNEVWGDDSYANSNALNVQITYLRRALHSDPSLSIEAIIRKGYILQTLA